MATLTAVNPRVVSGPVMRTVTKLIANGQSWKAGQFLSESSGLIAAASDSAVFKYLALTDQTDPGNATTTAVVGMIDKDHVFRMNELNGTVTAANIGIRYAIDVTSNVVTLDVDDTGNDSMIVVAIGSQSSPVEYADADVKGVVFAKVLQAVLEA